MSKKQHSYQLEILGEIAKGGQAQVLLARAQNGDLVAIKYFYDRVVFEQEAHCLSQIDHILIARFLGILDSTNSQGLIIEYVLGANFATLQDIMLKKSFALSNNLLLYFMQQILEILAYLESISIVHSDIAAENILVSSNGLLKLCDFGAAHGSFSGGFWPKPFGRQDFLAPEIIAGESSSRWSDLYALGAVLFEILMHRRFRPAHKDADLGSLRVRLQAAPQALYYLLSACLSQSPWQRPTSAAIARLRLPRLDSLDLIRVQQELGHWVEHVPVQLTLPAHKYYVDFFPRDSF
jgi:serine/threonine protein kinase